MQAIIHHTNPQGQALQDWQQPSSYAEYLGNRNTQWVHPEEVLVYFSKTNPNLTYKTFVETDSDLSVIQNKLLEVD